MHRILLASFAASVFACWFFSGIPGHCTSPLDTQLLSAVNSGEAGQVQNLLRRGANPNARYYRGTQSSTVLMESAALGNFPIVQTLLLHRARVNARGYTRMTGAPRGDGDYRQSTALIEACLRDGNDEIVLALLAHGADVNAVDKSGGTALSNSLWLSNWDQAQVLLAHGAHTDRKTRRLIARHLAQTG